VKKTPAELRSRLAEIENAKPTLFDREMHEAIPARFALRIFTNLRARDLWVLEHLELVREERELHRQLVAQEQELRTRSLQGVLSDVVRRPRASR
jgi:hypothetical protein